MIIQKISDKEFFFNRSRANRLLILFLFICSVILIWHALYWYGEINDDAFISFRYARNLAQGDGFSYNPGERVEGFSNFLWVILLASAARLGFTDLGFTSKVLGLLFSCGTLFLTAYIFRCIFAGLNPLLSVAPALFLSFNPYFASWAVRGMEVPFFAFLLSASVCLYLKNIHKTVGGLFLSGLSFFALSLTRPEGIVFLLLPLVGLLINYSKDRDRAKVDGHLLLLTSVLFILFLCWRIYYFGELYPNTFFAKIATGSPFFYKPRGIRYLKFFIFNQGTAFTILIITFLIAVVFKHRQSWFLILPVIISLLCAWYFNGDWMDNYRFLVPILPFLYILLISSPFLLKSLIATGKWTRIPSLVLIFLVSGGHLIHDIKIDKDLRYSRFENVLQKKSRKTWLTAPWRLPGLGFKPVLWNQTRWALENIDDSMLTAIPDIGFFGYATDALIYDTQGLVTQNISHLYYMKRIKKDSIDDDLVNDFMLNKPDYVFLRRNKKTAAGINRMEKALFSSPQFSEEWSSGPVFEINGHLEMALYIKDSAGGKLSDSLIARRYQEAIRWNPRIPYLYAGLKNIYVHMGERAKAADLSRDAKKRFPYARSF